MRATLWTIVAVWSMLWAGCVAPASSPSPTTMTTSCAEGCQPASNGTGGGRIVDHAAAYTLRFSDCRVVSHTINVPPQLFPAPYPPGTRAAAGADASVYVGAFLCDQGTDANSTAAPFHIAFFGASIDPPGPSAQTSTSTLAGFEVVTNHPAMAARLKEAGWKTRVGDGFSFETQESPSDEATAYALRVPATDPAYEFTGTIATRTSNAAQGTYGFYYYTAPEGSKYVLRVEYQGVRAGNSQPAWAAFGKSTFWADTTALEGWEAINARRYDVSGTLVLEPISTY